MKALRLRNLRKTYKGGVTAVRNIDLEVEQGDFFGLLGPNGAGKSTVIGIVSSLVTKSSGEVEVMGYDLERHPWEAKGLLGLVPQEFNFNHFETVEQIVLNQAGYYGMPRREARQRMERFLRELSLWEKRGAVSRTLSGGMKRRLMIARALIHGPKLLILDEPTAGVDIEVRRSMWQFLQRINRDEGVTIILTTHYLEEAENLCRAIAIIDEGQIIEHTDTQSLLARLSAQTFILDTREALGSAPELAEFPVHRLGPRQLEVEVRKEQSLSRLFQGLDRAGVEITSMKNKTNRLEELFIRLLEENDAAPAA